MLFPDHDVAVVTGASRGIGRAIALDLAAGGARVVVNYAKRVERAEEVVDEITRAGGCAIAVQADVGVEDDVRRLFRTVRTELGSVRVLVNNAGITDDGFVAMMSLAKWRHVQTVNLDGVFLCAAKACGPWSATRRPGGRAVRSSTSRRCLASRAYPARRTTARRKAA